MSIDELGLIWEAYNGGDIRYEISNDEDSDGVYITAYSDNIKIGEAGATVICGDFEYELDDVFSEDEIYEIFPANTLVKIAYIEVYKEYRNRGVAKSLMDMLMNKLIEMGFTQFYLNASPMGVYKGLSKNELVDFYKRYGFDVLLDQGNNTLMIKKL